MMRVITMTVITITVITLMLIKNSHLHRLRTLLSYCMNIFQNASIIFWQVRLQRASEGREDHKQRKDCGRSAKHHLLLGERSQVKYQQCLDHHTSQHHQDQPHHDDLRSVVVCSHLGRPDGLRNMKFTLAPVAEELRKLLNKVSWFWLYRL